MTPVGLLRKASLSMILMKVPLKALVTRRKRPILVQVQSVDREYRRLGEDCLVGLQEMASAEEDQ